MDVDKTVYHYDTYINLHNNGHDIPLPCRIFSETKIKQFTDAGRTGSPIKINDYTTLFTVRRIIFDYYNSECRIMLSVYKENHNED